MASRPLYLDSGTLTRIGSGAESAGIIEIQGIAAITDATTVDIFTDATGIINIGTGTTGNINIGTSSTGTITIGTGGVGGTAITLDGDVTVTGTETVTSTATMNGDVVIGSDATDTVDFNADAISDLTFRTDTTSYGIVSDNAAQPLKVTGAGAVDVNALAGGITLDADSGTIALTTTTSGDITADSIGAVSLSAAAASDFTVAGAQLQLLTTTSGEIDITSAGAVDVNAGAAFTIDGAAASTITVTGSTLGLTTTGANNITLTSGSGKVATSTSAANEAIEMTVASGGTPRTASIMVGNGSPDGAVSGSTGDLYLEVGSGTPYYNTGTTNWTAVGSANPTLQDAYDAPSGNTITTSGTTPIDFTLTSGGFNVTTSATGDIQFDNGTNNYLFIDGSTGATTLSGIGAALTLSTVTSGNVEILPVATNDVVITTSGAGGTVDINSGAGGVTVDATAGAIALTTTTSGDITADAAGAVSLSAAAASDFTVAGAQLQLLTTTSGEIDITSAGAVDVNAASGVTVDGTTLAFTGSSTATISSVGSSYWTNSTGQLQLITTTSGEIDITSAGAVDVNASGAVTIDAGAASNFTTSAGAIVVDAQASTLTLDGNSGVNIAANASEIDVTTTGALDLNSGAFTLDCSTAVVTATSTLDVDAAGALSLNSSGAAINIGNDDVDEAINIGTSGERAIEIGNSAAPGASSILITGGTGGAALEAYGTTGNVSVYGEDASNFTMLATNAADKALSISASNAGAGAGNIIIVADDIITFDGNGMTTPLPLNGTTAGDTGDQDLASTFTNSTLIGCLNELKSDVAGAGDVILNLLADAAITQYAGVYISSSGHVSMAQANAGSTSKFIGIALDAAAAAEDPVRVQVAGEASAIGTVATPGAYAYVSAATAGQLTTTAPSSGTVLKAGVVSASGKVVIQVGTAVSL